MQSADYGCVKRSINTFWKIRKIPTSVTTRLVNDIYFNFAYEYQNKTQLVVAEYVK